MRGERGQASVEWVGLVLLAALVLGGTASLVTDRDANLGRTVAARIGCAAKAACAIAPGERTPAVRPRPGPSTRMLSAAGVGPRATDAFRRLRGVAAVAKGAWIVCLGYRRWRYELDHPRSPAEPMPLPDALAIANACLNPYAFVADEWTSPR